jgi:hypothetical protein
LSGQGSYLTQNVAVSAVQRLLVDWHKQGVNDDERSDADLHVTGGLADMGVVQQPTVAVARVLGISSSNAAGCRFELIATERFW